MPEVDINLIGVMAGISILIGLVNCFFGYRIFKWILLLLGVYTGWALGFVAGLLYLDDLVLALLTAILGGIICGYLMFVLYFAVVFLLGASLGALLGYLVTVAAGHEQITILLIIPAVIGGVLGLIIQKFMIIATTSFGGANNVVMGAAHFIGVLDWEYLLHHPEMLHKVLASRLVLLLCWIILSVTGMVAQYTLTAGRKKEEKKQEQDEEEKEEEMTDKPSEKAEPPQETSPPPYL